MTSPITLTKSLANDPRSELEPWLEAVEKQARNLCPQHDITGALSLVVPDEVWKLVPQPSSCRRRLPARLSRSPYLGHACAACQQCHCSRSINLQGRSSTPHGFQPRQQFPQQRAIGQHRGHQRNLPQNGFSGPKDLHALVSTLPALPSTNKTRHNRRRLLC
jgi:hypothetical protein